MTKYLYFIILTVMLFCNFDSYGQCITYGIGSRSQAHPTQETDKTELLNPIVDRLANARFHVTMDCSQCRYKTKDRFMDFEYFLNKARRDEHWNEKSVAYFIEHFNDVAMNKGLMATSKSTTEDSKVNFEIVICPTIVYPSGKIDADVIIYPINDRSSQYKLSFSASGDDDDHITLRDPLKVGGKVIAKKLVKLLKL